MHSLLLSTTLISFLALAFHAAAIPVSGNTTQLQDTSSPVTCLRRDLSTPQKTQTHDCVAAYIQFRDAYPWSAGETVNLTKDSSRPSAPQWLHLPKSYTSGTCTIVYLFPTGDKEVLNFSKREIIGWSGDATFTCIHEQETNAALVKLDTSVVGQQFWIFLRPSDTASGSTEEMLREFEGVGGISAGYENATLAGMTGDSRGVPSA